MRSRMILSMLCVLLLLAVAACQPTTTSGVAPTAATGTTPGPVTTGSPEIMSTGSATSVRETATPEMTGTSVATSTKAATDTAAATSTLTRTATLTVTPPTTGTLPATLTSQQLMPHGEEVFTANCSMCHGANGQGQGSFPALANNPDVIASVPVTITQFVVHGSSGQHNFGDKLSDLDIAAVLTYIRGSWGNKALPVSELDVQAVRQNPVIKPTP